MCEWRTATLTKTVPLPDGGTGVEMEIGYLTPTENAAKGEKEVADFLRRCVDTVVSYGENKLLARARREYEAIAAQVEEEKATRLASLTDHARKRYVAGVVRQRYRPYRLVCGWELRREGALLTVSLTVTAEQGGEVTLQHRENMTFLMPQGFLTALTPCFSENREKSVRKK